MARMMGGQRGTAILTMVVLLAGTHARGADAGNAADIEMLMNRVAALTAELQQLREEHRRQIKELEARIAAAAPGGLEALPPASGANGAGAEPVVPRAAAEPTLDDIFGEIDASRSRPLFPPEGRQVSGAVSDVPTGERSVQEIVREVGHDSAAKLPWFPSMMNPQIFAVVETVGRVPIGGRRDSTLEMREMELGASGSVDPLGQASVLLAGADDIAVEEAQFLFTGLPFNLQLRAGKFFSHSSFINKTHTHDLPFVDQPLAMQNFMGTYEPVSLTEAEPLTLAPQHVATGFELSWLVPVDVYWKVQANLYRDFSDRGDDSFWRTYLESGADGAGDPRTPFDYRDRNRNVDDFAYGVGSRMYLDLAADHGVMLGANCIYDAPRGRARRTTESLAVSYRWSPIEGGLYKGLEWTTEVFANQERFFGPETGIGAQDTWGAYSFVSVRLGRRFSTGLLGEWSQFRFDRDAEAWHAAAWLSYTVSERQRIRAQVDWFDMQPWQDAVASRLGSARRRQVLAVYTAVGRGARQPRPHLRIGM